VKDGGRSRGGESTMRRYISKLAITIIKYLRQANFIFKKSGLLTSQFCRLKVQDWVAPLLWPLVKF
jgi:hypothetical protein